MSKTAYVLKYGHFNPDPKIQTIGDVGEIQLDTTGDHAVIFLNYATAVKWAQEACDKARRAKDLRPMDLVWYYDVDPAPTTEDAEGFDPDIGLIAYITCHLLVED